MAKIPTYEEIAKKVAEKALDEFLYEGKSIREWIKIIASEDAISRQAVLDLVNADWKYEGLEEPINSLPSVNPQKPKSEWEHDHEILKAYSDGASAVIDKIRAEIDEEYDRVHPYDISCAEGLEMALNIVDKYKAESEDKD